MEDLNFNSNPSYIMHIDLNSCFATIEQQANPHLRGKPIAVAAYASSNGCILAPSIEAKTYGVKTGMKVKDGKNLCPSLVVLSPDPWKYRNVHLKLRRLLSTYTNDFNPKSIDEFVLNLEDYLTLACKDRPRKQMQEVGLEIKKRIKEEIGDWLTVSVGISTNRYLAKVASGLKKPDGLETIDKDNFLEVYSRLQLTDFPYIKTRNAARLSAFGINTVSDFYKADIRTLKAAFHSINGYYWYLRLRGFEIDDVVFGRRSYGNSYALPKPFSKPADLAPILAKLVTKMSARVRAAGYKATGVHLAIVYRGGGFWHQAKTVSKPLFATNDIYKEAFRILLKSPQKPVANLAVSCFNLLNYRDLQLELFEDVDKKAHLVNSIDEINERWGDFVVTPGRMLKTGGYVPDRIAFGGVKELEEFTTLRY